MAEGKLTLVAEFGSRDLVGFFGAITRREVERRSRRGAVPPEKLNRDDARVAVW
jgi:hypothetical protein